MAKVLFLCRFQKTLDDALVKEIEDALDVGELTSNTFYDREKERNKLMKDANMFDYAPFMFDLKDVCASNFVDNFHTNVRLYNSFNYTLKVPYDKFLDIYTALLQTAINDFTEVDFNKPNEQTLIQSKFSKNAD